MNPPNKIWYCQLVDLATGEVMRTHVDLLSPMTGNHGIEGWEWKSVDISPEAMWERFIQKLEADRGPVRKNEVRDPLTNFLGSIKGYKKSFKEAN